MNRRTGFVPILIATLGASCTIGCAINTDGLKRPDIVTDASPSDAGTDGGVMDDAAPPDAALPDSGPFDADLPDAGDIDAGDDAGPDDAGTDAGDDAGTDAGVSPVGCADGTVEQPYPGHPDIAGCDGAVDQCTAETLCGAGWHLCSVAVYRTRGGDLTPATTYRWLAGCVRELCGGLIGPGTSICASCAPGTGSSLDVSYDCSVERAHADDACNLGILADTDPIGNHLVSRAAACTRAGVLPAETHLGATCCR